jgi:hypothetical protein
MLGALMSLFTACVAGPDQSEDGEPGVACSEHEVRASVRGQVALPVHTERSLKPRKLFLSVYQSSSAQCDGEFVQVVAPGRQLLHTEIDSAAFDLEVIFTTVDEDLRDPWLEIRVFEDLNANGSCDDDELSGYAQSAADGSLSAPLELTTLGCPGRA